MNNMNITSWRTFESNIREKRDTLLNRLDDFGNAILVAGCQRSGTTVLTRAMWQGDGMRQFSYGNDDELDAALILSGYVNHQPNGRYCFQTTYLNNFYNEYFDHDNYQIIWVLRNPHSVVYSMLHNWRRGALKRLFNTCGSRLLDNDEGKKVLGVWTVSRLKQACLSYNAKVKQAFELNEKLGSDRLMIVDYDDVVNDAEQYLGAIYHFAGISYSTQFADIFHQKSTSRAKKKQSASEVSLVTQLCVPVYNEARKLITDISRYD